jgi:hypothetical protein
MIAAATCSADGLVTLVIATLTIVGIVGLLGAQIWLCFFDDRRLR